MSCVRVASLVRIGLVVVAAASLGGCGFMRFGSEATGARDCMARVMYFESNRSSDEGMLAVGTVVMNRRESGKYPSSVCGVVGQSNQFAPGALSLPMNGVGRARAYRMADAVLSGQRHNGMQGVYFFHTAGWVPPFNNMHYVLVAGGNAFYEKRAMPAYPDQAPVPAEAPARTMVAARDPTYSERTVQYYRPPPQPVVQPPEADDDDQASAPQDATIGPPVGASLVGQDGPLYQSIY